MASKRRSRYEPLQVSRHDRWLVARNMFRELKSCELLPAGTDLKAALVRALAERAAAGWELESFASTSACAFCRQGENRVMIGVEVVDPRLNP
jgi:hypothetical protein